nr:PTS lactose/cellobiose transporter subunit IIA [uncultured Peptostreptococcus sp.]
MKGEDLSRTQIRYELNNLKKVAQDIPVEAINMQDYGMMNGKKVLKEACGEKTEFSILLMHSEDQMASTELSKILAQEVIELHKELNSIKN